MTVLAGFLIALAVGVTGIGAGSLTVPLLVLLGASPAAAVATALAFTVVLKLVAAPFCLLARQVDFRILRKMLAGALPGVLAGSYLLKITSRPAWNPVLLLVLGALVMFTAALNLFRFWRPSLAQRDRTRWIPWLALPIGFEIGFSSAGAGVLGNAVLLGFSGLAPAQVVGTDMIFGLVASAAGAAFHLGTGFAAGAPFWRLLAGGIPGVLLGLSLSHRIPVARLKLILTLLLVVLGFQLMYSGATAWLNPPSAARASTRHAPVIAQRHDQPPR